MPGRSVLRQDDELPRILGVSTVEARSTMPGNTHAIKPWFAGKLAFSPRFSDLADDGC